MYLRGWYNGFSNGCINRLLYVSSLKHNYLVEVAQQDGNNDSCVLGNIESIVPYTAYTWVFQIEYYPKAFPV